MPQYIQIGTQYVPAFDTAEEASAAATKSVTLTVPESERDAIIDALRTAKEAGPGMIEAVTETPESVAPRDDQAWRPLIGDTYWMIVDHGGVRSMVNHNYQQDMDRSDVGNVFHTREAAERRAQAIRDLTRLRRAEDCDGVNKFHLYGWCYTRTFFREKFSITGRGFSSEERANTFYASLGADRENRLNAIAEYMFGPR